MVSKFRLFDVGSSHSIASHHEGFPEVEWTPRVEIMFEQSALVFSLENDRSFASKAEADEMARKWADGLFGSVAVRESFSSSGASFSISPINES